MFNNQLSKRLFFCYPKYLAGGSYELMVADYPFRKFLNFLKILDILYFELIMYKSDLCIGCVLTLNVNILTFQIYHSLNLVLEIIFNINYFSRINDI